KMNGWAVGQYGLIFHTTDGGVTWKDQSIKNVNIFRMSVFFINANIGWVASDVGELYHTTNSGSTWVKQSGFSNYSTSIFFLDSNIGWFGGGGVGTILHTTNGGNTWQSDNIPSSGGISGIAFTSPQNGWIIAGNGSILHTINGTSFSGIKLPITNNSELLTIKNYPNPLNSITTFNYNIPKSSFVTLRIINALGEEVSQLVSEVESEGTHEVKWDAHDMPNGIYFCELRSGAYSQSVRVIVMR
ncbi:MAG: YCF48-related protein, partial [Candidatus Kapaibacterium sp.]